MPILVNFRTDMLPIDPVPMNPYRVMLSLIYLKGEDKKNIGWHEKPIPRLGRSFCTLHKSIGHKNS
jgi:hypothetical protein